MDYFFRNKTLQKLGFSDYAAYLQSDLWVSIRQRVLEKHSWICCGCQGRASQCHHTSYEEAVLLGLNLEPLKPICNYCHRDIEFDADGKVLDLRAVNERLRILMEGRRLPEKQHQRRIVSKGERLRIQKELDSQSRWRQKRKKEKRHLRRMSRRATSIRTSSEVLEELSDRILSPRQERIKANLEAEALRAEAAILGAEERGAWIRRSKAIKHLESIRKELTKYTTPNP